MDDNFDIKETSAATIEASNTVVQAMFVPGSVVLAHGSMIIMAVLPVLIGSFRSVSFHQNQKISGEEPETISMSGAALAPFILSGVLYTLHSLVKLQSSEQNDLSTIFSFILAFQAISYIFKPFVSQLVTFLFPSLNHSLSKKGEEEKKKGGLLNFKIDVAHVLNVILSGVIALLSQDVKHWILDNMVGMTLCAWMIEMFSLNKVKIGFTLLTGLLFYDIFWVFCTDIMKNMALSLNAPIKLVFPVDILENGLNASRFAFIGLGDIVLPGIFIALLLRFGLSLKCPRRVYFYYGMVGYVFALVVTFLISHIFKHVQPALLYLVPICLALPTLAAFMKGDLATMFQYEDYTFEEINAGSEKKK
ncbi:hypothetical protein EGW08_014235 [Elysia chlorotica]|uniref:Minor histocompatibility antigen H13 n=1 Tax=Elysia chlorotica TaxID=188477 RepID=A0A3S1B912_ELYCH|nr:hypothetical protein EGW08_014235 [Elysia chlorotica]